MSNTTTIKKAVIYARFSSDLQRAESIDAQIRACRYYAQKENIEIVDVYTDHAKSGTTVKGRDAFLQMIQDSSKQNFEIVMVHKLNRFGRNSLDTLQYKQQLEHNGVTLISVTEHLDNTPEGKLMLMVITGMNEFYSTNLKGEVMKGLKENAYNCKHTGGIPPLGYDLDQTTKKLVLNDVEAQAVKIIFDMYLQGLGYSEIISFLNTRGYKTKKGQAFSKSSIYEVLRQEKYTGTYVYNKSASKNVHGRFNRHKFKEDNEIIRVEDAIPQIVSKENFALVQKKMAERKHKAAQFSAKETYLLSGKIICGKCGANYTGINRKARKDHPQYVSYRCSKKHGKNKCDNTGIRRETLETFVLEKLSSVIFSDDMLPMLIDEYKKYALEADKRLLDYQNNISSRMQVVTNEINNIVSVVASTGSDALISKLKELEEEKRSLTKELKIIEADLKNTVFNEKNIKKAFKEAKKLFSQGNLSTNKLLIDNFIDRIIIYDNYIEIYFNIGIKAPQNPDDSGAFCLYNLLVVKEQRTSI